MAQIFHPSTNTISKFSIFCFVFIAAGLFWLAETIYRSSFATRVGVPREQPIPFSHRHHAGGIGIDCRYCHTSVETSSFAGIPSTETCMGCHSHIWADSPALEPVRRSFRTGRPIEWARVNGVPGFVYFNHAIHVKKGVGCATCHGQVEAMPLTWKGASLYMEWCLECHRAPERFIRPPGQVFNMAWRPEETQEVLGRRLAREHRVESLTNCTHCHR